MEFALEIIRILVYLFFLLAVALVLCAIVVGVVLFAMGEGVVWLGSHRPGSRSSIPGHRFGQFR